MPAGRVSPTPPTRALASWNFAVVSAPGAAEEPPTGAAPPEGAGSAVPTGSAGASTTASFVFVAVVSAVEEAVDVLRLSPDDEVA